jgi:cyclohexanecarboxylate-CoA ligase
MATSSKVVYMDRWQAGVAMRIMRAENVTYAPAMPTYLVDIMAHPDFHQASLSSWRAARVSGGPINGAVLKRMAAELPHLGLFRGWGMTEALMITGCGPHDPPEKRLATDGRPLGGARVIIRSPDSAEDCPAWITGEVLVRSESTMLGYYEQPELTGSAYTADGWLRSGDLGYLDDEGYLTIAGRIKDLVIRGGENVPVKDVEELIAELPSVRQVCVVGVPDARLGEKVCAVVQSAGSTTLAEIRAHLISRQLTRQFIPELLVLVEHLPSSSVSKVQRDEVREIALARLSECA